MFEIPPSIISALESASGQLKSKEEMLKVAVANLTMYEDEVGSQQGTIAKLCERIEVLQARNQELERQLHPQLNVLVEVESGESFALVDDSVCGGSCPSTRRQDIATSNKRKRSVSLTGTPEVSARKVAAQVGCAAQALAVDPVGNAEVPGTAACDDRQVKKLRSEADRRPDATEDSSERLQIEIPQSGVVREWLVGNGEERLREYSVPEGLTSC
jgi:hypothetical protein